MKAPIATLIIFCSAFAGRDSFKDAHSLQKSQKRFARDLASLDLRIYYLQMIGLEKIAHEKAKLQTDIAKQAQKELATIQVMLQQHTTQKH